MDPCSVYVSAHYGAVVELMLLYVPLFLKVPFGVYAICTAQFSTIATDGIAPLNWKILDTSFPLSCTCISAPMPTPMSPILQRSLIF